VKIDLLVTASSPFSHDYLTFFACIESWAPAVDQIIWVDGGAEDGSFEKLTCVTQSKIKRVKSLGHAWDVNKAFSPNHINSMMNEGISLTRADWLIVVFADYILDGFDRVKMEEELNQFEDELWVKYERRKIYCLEDGSATEVVDNRGSVILNMSALYSDRQYPYFMGINKSNKIYDYPLRASDYCGVINYNSYKEIIPRGEMLEGGVYTLASLRVFVSDHPFYKPSRAIDQRLQFNKYFDALAVGEAPISKSQAKDMVNFGVTRITKKTLLELDLPHEFLVLINEYYSPERLIAHAKRSATPRQQMLSRIARYIKTRILRLSGFRGVFEQVHFSRERDDINFYPLEGLHEKQLKNKIFRALSDK